jgi:hypothetical protein
MLCPKRKWKYPADLLSSNIDQEEFSPCLEKECAAWRVKVFQPLHQNAIINGQLTATKDAEVTMRGYCGLGGAEDLP